MTCARNFDEELISGYLDRSLPQAQSQRVRLHLEDCAACRELHTELELLRSAARSTRFEIPDDEEWPEAPRTGPSRWSRILGWALLVPWLIVAAAVALWRFVTEAGGALEIFLGLGLVGGLVFLFASVLLDRLEDLKTDRYREIHR